jgi:ATP-dependent RNA helicase SUPV3L1/SUV3
MGARVAAFAEDEDAVFTLSPRGDLAWRGARVARLLAGERLLEPQVDPLASDLLDAALRERVRRRLAEFLDRHLAAHLAPLFRLSRAASRGPARGLAFALSEGLGSVARSRVSAQVAGLSVEERTLLSRAGVTLGRTTVFLPALLDAATLRLRGVLVAVGHGRAPRLEGAAAVCDPEHAPGAYEACGYQPAGRLAVRVDVLHRIAVNLARLAQSGPFALPREVEVLLGRPPEDAAELVGALGYVRRGDRFVARRERVPDASRRRA